MKFRLACCALIAITGCLDDRTTPPETADDVAVDPPETTSDPAAPDVPEPEDADDSVLLPLGASCLVDGECEDGRCAHTCEDGAFCVPNDCQTDADCGGPVAGSAVCCVDGACGAVRGSACGDRKGTQGASCAEGGVSACGAGHDCLAQCLPTAYCAAACSDDAECPGAIDECYPVAGGASYCITDPDNVGICELDDDCAAGQACGIYLSFHGGAIIKKCAAAEGGGGGASCNVAQQCKLGICWNDPGQNGACASVCNEDTDCACGDDRYCAHEQICVPIVFSLGVGQADSVKMCYDGVRCTSNAACVEALGPGAECGPSWALDEVVELCEAQPYVPGGKTQGSPCEQNAECNMFRCVQGQCYNAVAAGDKCGDCAVTEGWCDQLCISKNCFEGRCTMVCQDDAECAKTGSDRVCVSYGFSVTDGLDHSQICIEGPRCESAADCAGGELCAGVDEGDGWATVCRPEPYTNGALAAGEACAGDGQCETQRCHNGLCAARAAVGEPCTRGPDCLTAVCAAAGCAQPCTSDDHCPGACVEAVAPTASNPAATLTVCDG